MKINNCDVPVGIAFDMASAYPAKVIGIQGERGIVAPGKAASLLLLSDEFVLQKVFVEGVEHFIGIN